MMENIVQLFFSITSSLGAYPFKINLIPATLDFKITVKRKSYMWKLSVFYLLLYAVKANVTFFLSLKIYFDYYDFLLFMFHCIWANSFIISSCKHLCFIFHKGKVMQLANGTVLFKAKFTRGKPEYIFVSLLIFI